MPARSFLSWMFFVPMAALGVTGHCYEDGAPAAHTGGFGEPDCSLCHSDSRKNVAGGELNIDGLPPYVTMGAEYELSVVLRHPKLSSGGFQLALRHADGTPAGQVVPLSEATQVVTSAGQEYLQHAKNGLKAEGDGVIRWIFRWIAAGVTAPVHVHVAANAANDDASALGDYIFTYQRVLPVDTAEAASLTGSRRNR